MIRVRFELDTNQPAARGRGRTPACTRDAAPTETKEKIRARGHVSFLDVCLFVKMVFKYLSHTRLFVRLGERKVGHSTRRKREKHMIPKMEKTVKRIVYRTHA